MNEELKIEYIPLSQIKLWEENPKQHDIEKLWQSIKQNGFQNPAKYSDKLGGILYGNGRIETLQLMKKAGEEAPRGILVEDGEWLIPIVRGVDFDSKEQATAYALDENLIGMFGGDITHLEASRIYDQEAYLRLLEETIEHSTTSDLDDLALLKRLLNEVEEEEQDDDPPPPPKAEKHSFTLHFSSKMTQQKFLDYVNEHKEEYFGDYLLDLLESD